jgi:hypothetical protein
MAGRGPTPKPNRRNKSDVPSRGEWRPAPGSGWQHGEVPAPPDGLLAKSRATWATWFASWSAGHWNPDHLPDVYVAIRLFDAFERGDHARAPELRQWMDGIGVTYKGQQDRRWLPPKEDPVAVPASSGLRRLRVVGE